MRQAMATAEVGDDVFGDDPTVIRLQNRVAELLGKEASLYMPSGTMANQAGLAALTAPGDEIYCHINAHLFNYEAGGASALSGVVMNIIEGANGAFTADQVSERLRPKDSHYAQSKVIWVENSANRSGGCIFPQDEVLRLRKLADEHGLKMHLDGARIWNVAVATGMSEAELAAPFDSVNVCLSKGLGAPVGSLVVGSKDFIAKVHRFRKRFGGGMRQAGIIAAGGLYAVENHRKRLAEDHRRARLLAETIESISKFDINISATQTNIIIFETIRSGYTGAQIVAQLREQGIWATYFGSKIRMVTHLDIDDDDIEKTIKVLRSLYA